MRNVIELLFKHFFDSFLLQMQRDIYLKKDVIWSLRKTTFEERVVNTGKEIAFNYLEKKGIERIKKKMKQIAVIVSVISFFLGFVLSLLLFFIIYV